MDKSRYCRQPLKDTLKPAKRQNGTTQYGAFVCRAQPSILTTKIIERFAESSWTEDKIQSKS